MIHKRNFLIGLIAAPAIVRYASIMPVRAITPMFDVEVPDIRHIVRSDNGHVLGTVSDCYHPCQPLEVLGWFEQYISVDDRFQLDVAGSLKQNGFRL